MLSKTRLSYPPEGSITVSTKPVIAGLIDLKPVPAHRTWRTEKLQSRGRPLLFLFFLFGKLKYPYGLLRSTAN
jgi:hypothetical protein